MPEFWSRRNRNNLSHNNNGGFTVLSVHQLATARRKEVGLGTASSRAGEPRRVGRGPALGERKKERLFLSLLLQEFSLDSPAAVFNLDSFLANKASNSRAFPWLLVAIKN